MYSKLQLAHINCSNHNILQNDINYFFIKGSQNMLTLHYSIKHNCSQLLKGVFTKELPGCERHTLGQALHKPKELLYPV